MALAVVFEFVLSHCDDSFCLQKKQSPHAIWNDATYRFPTLTLATFGPVAMATPQNSWPRMSPFAICTTDPCRRCRSLPQMVVPVTLRMTSASSMIMGFATSAGYDLRGCY
jgi:hypothetical protein